jgi:plasmid stability protein
MQSSHLTLRKVPKEILSKLRREAKRHGISMNKFAAGLLARSLGLDPKSKDNGLGALSGSWSEEEFQEFSKATRSFSTPDPELWK